MKIPLILIYCSYILTTEARRARRSVVDGCCAVWNNELYWIRPRMNNDIWVLVEHDGQDVAEVTLEILGEARKLADRSGDEVAALLAGYQVSALVDILAHYGADKVYLAEHEDLQANSTCDFVPAIFQLIRKYEPSVFLCGATPEGSALAPRLAARLRTGLATNCTVLKLNREGLLEMTSPAYGNRFYITRVCPAARPQMATVLPGAIGLGRPDTSRRARVIVESPQLPEEPAPVRSLGVIKADPRTVDISEADIVVAGGRGVGDAAEFDLIWQVADLVSASVASSRPVVDAGWVSKDRQVGLTGKTVSPGLYLSCGISGAIQHTMGMKDSKQIIAINNNPDAPILKIANVRILADLHEFLPALIERLRQVKGSQANKY